jgi:hypothetical protein
MLNEKLFQDVTRSSATIANNPAETLKECALCFRAFSAASIW